MVIGRDVNLRFVGLEELRSSARFEEGRMVHKMSRPTIPEGHVSESTKTDLCRAYESAHGPFVVSMNEDEDFIVMRISDFCCLMRVPPEMDTAFVRKEIDDYERGDFEGA